MIYLSILLLLFFHFWYFKGVNQLFTKAVILQFCKTVRQDDMSKRVAFEEEPLPLEKNNEDQSKYYLGCPKPSISDVKWENHDINVVECANILKFPPLLTE